MVCIKVTFSLSIVNTRAKERKTGRERDRETERDRKGQRQRQAEKGEAWIYFKARGQIVNQGF